MTSQPSQSSVHNRSAQRDRAALAPRRVQILAELDIDVWTLRPATTAMAQPASAVAVAQQQPGPTTPEGQQPASSGPAAARALLADSKQPSRANTTGATESAKVASAHVVEPRRAATNAVGAALDLLCLSGAHGLLLVPLSGLSPQARRLLKDILNSVTRVIENRLATAMQADRSAKSSQPKLQSLRFSWPPVVPGGDQIDPAVAQQSTGDAIRALRGFLLRQLQDKVEPVLLYIDSNNTGDGAGDLAELLQHVELPIAEGRRIALDPPELLMSNSALKRTLWRTLSAL